MTLLILKQLFFTAPILYHPDMLKHFTMEVNASDTDVGVVLPQTVSADGKLHPCVLFSWHLCPAKINYDVSNWEELAIKTAFEEWRQWLEGAELSFIIWRDHKNVAYIQGVKRLIVRQAVVAIFCQFLIFLLPMLQALIMPNQMPTLTRSSLSKLLTLLSRFYPHHIQRIMSRPIEKDIWKVQQNELDWVQNPLGGCLCPPPWLIRC